MKLYGQVPKTMEMVALRVGGLSSFSDGHGNGVLDAWWIKASVSPTAPVGDQVTVTPFLTTRTVRNAFHVRVATGDHAVQGARVSLRSNLMGSGMAPRPQAPRSFIGPTPTG